MGVLMANYCELFAHRYEVRDGAMAENEFGSFSVRKTMVAMVMYDKPI